MRFYNINARKVLSETHQPQLDYLAPDLSQRYISTYGSSRLLKSAEFHTAPR